MRKGLCLLAVMCLAPSPPEEQAKLWSVVNWAIQAHGGAANLARFKASTWKGHGQCFAKANGSSYTLMGARNGADQATLSVENEIEGQHYQLTRVINGNKGWVRLNGRTQELEAEQLVEEKERMYATWLGTLTPLVGGDFQLAEAGMADVEGRQAIGIRVWSPGHRDVILYFHRETGLLVKKVTKIKNVQHDGKEIEQETLYGDYHHVEGVMIARHVRVFWDGKLNLDTELTEVKPVEKVGEFVFYRPQPD